MQHGASFLIRIPLTPRCILKDMNLETVATADGGPYIFTLASAKRYGIYKIIIYAQTATDVIAGWKVSLIYF